jgi:type IV fimbrial biogenesis protein FimT
MKSENGFSLIEVIITIAVLAIIATFAIPSFIQHANESKLRDVVSMLHGDLERARSRAMRENANVAVLFNANGYTIFIDNGSGGGFADNWVRDGGEQLLCTRTLGNGVGIDMATATFPNNRTRFTARGYVGNSGVLKVKNSAGKQVTVDMNNRFGRIETS